MHVRAPAGTRIEETERYFAKVADAIRQVIPPKEVKTLIDNIGIPNSGINLSLSDGSLMSAADGEILVTLNEDHHPTPDYVRQLRKTLNDKFPDLTFFFSPPDIVTQVLNFGLPAPIDVQLVGPRGTWKRTSKSLEQLRQRIAEIPAPSMSHLQQVPLTPELQVTADRTLLSQFKLTQQDVANDLLVSLSSSGQVAPNFWLDPKTGVQYPLVGANAAVQNRLGRRA